MLVPFCVMRSLVILRHSSDIQLHYISPGLEPPAFWLALGIGGGTAHLGTPNLLSGVRQNLLMLLL